MITYTHFKENHSRLPVNNWKKSKALNLISLSDFQEAAVKFNLLYKTTSNSKVILSYRVAEILNYISQNFIKILNIDVFKF